MTQNRVIQAGDRFVDGDGHLWRVVRATETTVTLAGRAIEQKFALHGRGIVSDREFSRVEVPVFEHGFVEGGGLPDVRLGWRGVRELPGDVPA